MIKFLFSIKNINDNDIFKQSMKTKMKKWLKRKKEKSYKFENSDNKNSEPIATNNNRETQGKYSDSTAVIIVDSILNGIIQERLSRKECVAKVHNFRVSKVANMKYHVMPLLRKEPSFIIIHAGANDASYSTLRKLLGNIITLKSFITDNLLNCKVVISAPTLRTDDYILFIYLIHYFKSIIYT